MSDLTAWARAIGQTIRRIRLSQGLTQSDLAGDDFSKSYISQLERGSVVPSLRALDVLAGRLGVPSTFFIEGTGKSAGFLLKIATISCFLGELDQGPALARRLEPRPTSSATWSRSSTNCFSPAWLETQSSGTRCSKPAKASKTSWPKALISLQRRRTAKLLVGQSVARRRQPASSRTPLGDGPETPPRPTRSARRGRNASHAGAGRAVPPTGRSRIGPTNHDPDPGRPRAVHVPGGSQSVVSRPLTPSGLYHDGELEDVDFSGSPGRRPTPKLGEGRRHAACGRPHPPTLRRCSFAAYDSSASRLLSRSIICTGVGSTR